MIELKTGSMFDTDAKVLINTVNCLGVMGKGVAEQFKLRYPDMFRAYAHLCHNRLISPGTIHPWSNGRIIIINCATKGDWRYPSDYEWIAHILVSLRELLPTYNSNVAMPALGCGNGKLNWSIVQHMIKVALEEIPNTIYLFPPTKHV